MNSLSSQKRIAIVGAGCSGLAAAWALRDSGAEVTIFEKSRGFSGRAATRGKEDCRIDLGANYFRAETPEVHDLVYQRLPNKDLVEIEKPVWVFDQSGKISPGDATLDDLPKLNYRQGISTLGKLLAAETKATVHLQTHVELIKPVGDHWVLHFQDDREPHVADQVVVTAPAPQAHALFESSDLGDELASALTASVYHSQFAYALAFEGESSDREFHALLNLDRGHPIAWLSYENDKAGHVQPDLTVVIAQMAPAWTERHYDTPREEIATMIEEQVRTLQPSLRAPLEWWSGQRWRYAHPKTAAEAVVLRSGEPRGLYFAGDALYGKGRVHLALQSGLDVGARLALGT